jgi:hypothetical protein
MPCPCCMSILHVRTVCPCSMSVLIYVRAAYSCCIDMLHVHAHVHSAPAARLCCVSMLHGNAASSCSMLLLHVHAACMCSMPMSMLHIRAVGHVHGAYSWCMSLKCKCKLSCQIKRKLGSEKKRQNLFILFANTSKTEEKQVLFCSVLLLSKQKFEAKPAHPSSKYPKSY